MCCTPSKQRLFFPLCEHLQWAPHLIHFQDDPEGHKKMAQHQRNRNSPSQFPCLGSYCLKIRDRFGMCLCLGNEWGFTWFSQANRDVKWEALPQGWETRPQATIPKAAGTEPDLSDHLEIQSYKRLMMNVNSGNRDHCLEKHPQALCLHLYFEFQNDNLLGTMREAKRNTKAKLTFITCSCMMHIHSGVHTALHIPREHVTLSRTYVRAETHADMYTPFSHKCGDTIYTQTSFASVAAVE